MSDFYKAKLKQSYHLNLISPTKLMYSYCKAKS